MSGIFAGGGGGKSSDIAAAKEAGVSAALNGSLGFYSLQGQTVSLIPPPKDNVRFSIEGDLVEPWTTIVWQLSRGTSVLFPFPFKGARYRIPPHCVLIFLAVKNLRTKLLYHAPSGRKNSYTIALRRNCIAIPE